VGEQGSFWAEGGESSNDVGHPDIGGSGILGGGDANNTSGHGSDSETHLDGMKVVVGLVLSD